MGVKLILTIFVAIVILNITNGALVQSRERPNILKFFNNTDLFEKTLIKNQTEIIIDMLSGFVNSVKPEDRGPSCTLIINYIGELSLAKNSNNLPVIKQKYTQLESLSNQLLNNFNIFPTKENNTLKAKWLTFLILPFKFQPSLKIYAQKLKSAARILDGRFSNPGKRRHRKLFRLLSSLQQISDPASDASFMKRFETIKADYRANRL